MKNAKERDEQTIRNDIEAAKIAAREAWQTLPAGEARKFEGIIIQLGDELSALLSKGANPCPQCSQPPMGILRTPAYTDSRGIDLPALYEVGCIFCPMHLVEREDGSEIEVDGKVRKVKRRSVQAYGYSPAEAAKNWNENKWAEDRHFERMRPEQMVIVE